MNLADCFPSEIVPPKIKCGTWLFDNVDKTYGVFAQTGIRYFQYIAFNQNGTDANRCSSPIFSSTAYNDGFTKEEVLAMFSNYWPLNRFSVVERPF